MPARDQHVVDDHVAAGIAADSQDRVGQQERCRRSVVHGARWAPGERRSTTGAPFTGASSGRPVPREGAGAVLGRRADGEQRAHLGIGEAQLQLTVHLAALDAPPAEEDLAPGRAPRRTSCRPRGATGDDVAPRPRRACARGSYGRCRPPPPGPRYRTPLRARRRGLGDGLASRIDQGDPMSTLARGARVTYASAHVARRPGES